MSNWIGPTVKQLWNYAMRLLHNFLGFNMKHNSFLLGPIQPSSSITKELHDLSIDENLRLELDIDHRTANRKLF